VCWRYAKLVGSVHVADGGRQPCRCLQDMITDELVGMAAGMKTNTLAMESQLRHRCDTVHHEMCAEVLQL
jgi:hypothetical protein